MKCPRCGETITKLSTELVRAEERLGVQAVVVLTCPHCQAMLGIAPLLVQITEPKKD